MLWMTDPNTTEFCGVVANEANTIGTLELHITNNFSTLTQARRNVVIETIIAPIMSSLRKRFHGHKKMIFTPNESK
jgi:hypothetical protein